MTKTDSNDGILLARKGFLSGRKAKSAVGPPAIRGEILTSWESCLRRGLRPAFKPLETKGRDNKPLRPSSADEFKQDRQLTEFSEYLAGLGAAFFLILDDGSVMHCGGNTKILDDLKRCGLDERCEFTEEAIGTTAVALCAATDKEALVTGAEHYLECLMDYTTFACRVASDYSMYFLCLVMPCEASPLPFVALSRYFLQVSAVKAELFRKSLEQTKYEIMFDQLKDNLKEALILVDFSRRIISVNKVVESIFNVARDDIIGCALTEIFPELENATSCLFTGKVMNLAEVNFEGLPEPDKVLYVSCSPWKRNGILDGMVITLTRPTKFSKTTESKNRYRDAYTFDDFIGSSQVFQETKEMAKGVAGSNSSIILTGESGTGKELFAKAIHNASSRSHKPFVIVNCSAIPRELIGSELFGYTEGAFTGAKKGGNMGKFEFANGGTLFLDEIGELPLEVQAVLLRVLEERSVVRIGANTAIPLDVRIISATNRNLMQMVRDNQFRLDLYYRLNVITIEIPSLRERSGDIPLLVRHFLDVIGDAHGKRISRIAQEAMVCLTSYSWPGNVRQLRNVMERCIAMSNNNELRFQDLPPEITSPLERPVDENVVQPVHVAVNDMEKKSYSEWERERIWQLMQKYKANKTKIASELGIARGTLYKKIRDYGL
jgi:transcriptional regulator with PAS, ATPase and Fis domain